MPTLVGLISLKNGSKMGYYTSYSLSIDGPLEEEEKFRKLLLKQAKDWGGYDDMVQELLDTNGIYAKLYELESWVGNAAEKCPNTFVILEGFGEGDGDWWQERWKGKHHERHEAIIPPFEDKELLTDNEKENQK